VSPDGAWVAFGSYAVRHDTDENIYVARVDGTELRALTSDVGKANRLPRWSADGARVVFYSNRSGHYEVWSVAPDGSELRQLTEAPDKSILYAIPASSGTEVTAIMNERGMIRFDRAKPFADQQVKEIPRCPGEECQLWPIDWSPDGKTMAGVAEINGQFGGVWTYGFEDGRYERITSEGLDPRWLRDGRRIAYTSDADFHVRIVSLTDRKSVDTTFALTEDSIYSVANDEVGHLAFSPNEDWLYFSRMTEDGDVWLAELE
jgi:Tol biopolymer transport system component